MNNEKSRCKALKTVVGVSGVESAAVKGDEVEVVGDGIDAVVLTRALRKCVAPADLISVGEAKKPEEKKPETPATPPVWSFYPRPYYPICEVRDPYPETPCTIM
ncbi:Hypothetical predicted protein [Olea europaea subsp. europaea]|uniref:Uncharacterized protein n=1 Tax=Olea europaea subsp. europaea TaxID=158383 RepID=A0A8S0QA26_OLEEU|nr:Hypothetical predicted protein [Olea europaea subsp. europaea]